MSRRAAEATQRRLSAPPALRRLVRSRELLAAIPGTGGSPLTSGLLVSGGAAFAGAAVGRAESVDR